MLKCEFLKCPLQECQEGCKFLAKRSDPTNWDFEIPSPLTGGLQSLQPQFSGKNDTAILGSVQWVATPVEHNRAMGNIVKSIEGYRKESRSESPSLPCVGSSGNHLGTVFDSFCSTCPYDFHTMEINGGLRKIQKEDAKPVRDGLWSRLCL